MINWQTFVVRIWQEVSSGTWRGQIVHLPDQDSRHFATLAQAAAFIEQYVPSNSAPRGEQTLGAQGGEGDTENP